jgi:hypothetical protein
MKTLVFHGNMCVVDDDVGDENDDGCKVMFKQIANLFIFVWQTSLLPNIKLQRIQLTIQCFDILLHSNEVP